MLDPDRRARENERSRSPERKHKARSRQYGLTVDELTRLYEYQQSCCWTCDEPENGTRLSIHHDHTCCNRNGSCGECVVALLCRNCNRRAETFERLLGDSYPLKGFQASAFETLFGIRWAALFGPKALRPRYAMTVALAA